MKFELMLQWLFNAVPTAGISSAIICVLIWFLRNYFAKLISSRVQAQYDESLLRLKTELHENSNIAIEKLRAEISRETKKLEISSASFSRMQNENMTMRLKSVQEIWKATLKIRENTHDALTMTDILTDHEIGTPETSQLYQSALDDLNEENIHQLAKSLDQNEEIHRPYCSEVLWSTYYSYRSIILRIAFLQNSGKGNPSSLHWYSDSNIRNLISSSLGQSALQDFDSSIGRYTWLRSRFELTILHTIRNLITGENYSEAAFSHAEKIEKLISESKRTLQ